MGLCVSTSGSKEKVAPAPTGPPKISQAPQFQQPIHVPDTAYISPQMAAIPEDKSVIPVKGSGNAGRAPAGRMFSLEAVGGQGGGGANLNNAATSNVVALGAARGSDGFRTSEGTPLAVLHVQRSLKMADFANSPTPSGRHGIPARTPSRRSIENRRNSVDRGTYNREEVFRVLSELPEAGSVTDSEQEIIAKAAKQIPALAGLRPSDLLEVSRHATVRPLSPWAPLMEEGATCEGMAVLRSGTARRVHPEGEEDETIMEPGALLNEWALDMDGLNKATITAGPDTSVWWIEGVHLLKLAALFHSTAVGM